MTVSLSQVLASARARSAPLAGECAGYLVLAAADHAAQGPRRIEAGSVELHADGSVRVVGGLPSNEATTERDLRELLDELLLVAGSVTPSLLRAARRRTGSGIDGFVREIETALIPVNRAAARRALSRLERETSRAVERGALAVEDQRVSDRVRSPAPPPASLTPPPASLTPPPASLTPPPASLTPPPASLTPPPVLLSHTARPASDLAPTPVAVPVRAKVTLPPAMVEETPSRFETRPETVVARASRPPKPSVPPPVATPKPAVPASHVSLSPSAGAPCTPPPPESMTPFLGTATARSMFVEAPVTALDPPASSRSVTQENEAELDVPIDVEVPVDEVAVAASVDEVASAAPVDEVAVAASVDEVASAALVDEVAVAAPVREVASAAPVDDVPIAASLDEVDDIDEDDIVEASPDELTEPFYLDGEGTGDVSPLAFHELTSLMTSVALIDEPAIELAESPTPAPHVSPPSEVITQEEEIAVPVAVVLAAVAEVPAVESVPVAEIPAIEAAPVALEPKRNEFEAVELAVLLPSAEPPPVVLRKPVDPGELLPRRPLPRQSASNVDDLLRSFGHAAGEGTEEQDVRSTLKRLAGLEPTPLPGASRD